MVDSLGALLTIVIRFAPTFGIYYLIMYFYRNKKKPANVYHLKPQEFEVWNKRNQQIQLLLALGYLLTGAAAFLPGYWFGIPLVFLMVVYVFRVKNNMSRIH